MNLLADLETAIAARSEETGVMLRRITDLFLLHAGHYSADQLDVYDEVLKTLIDKVEVAARAELAQRLAPLKVAPRKTIVSLALDHAIEVAEPVLTQSETLDDETLSVCIAANGQDHLLAIANRSKLSETVSGQLVIKGDKKVLGALANNPGAAISEPSFGILVQKSAGDDWLSEIVARRADIPEHHFRELVSKASEVVRQRLLSSNPNIEEIVEEILPHAMPASKQQAEPVRDYRTAELVVASRPLTEAVVIEFARAKKHEEIIVSLAQLSSLSAREIERIFMSTWSSSVAIILKAIGFQLASLDTIYHSMLNRDVEGRDLTQTKAEFVALRRPTAQRIMRFLAVRKSSELSEPA